MARTQNNGSFFICNKNDFCSSLRADHIQGGYVVTESEDIRAERRQKTLDPAEVGKYSPGIIRLEKIVEAELGKHDEKWTQADPSQWQTAYSLLEHCIQLTKVMGKVGVSRHRNEHEMWVGHFAALLHDIGKLNDACQVYRLNRKLTPEEKEQIDLHSIYSGNYTLTLMSLVRAEDRRFLADAHQVIRYHHYPWEISDPVLREIGFDLKFVDIFVSLMETRERPGLTPFEAVETLEEIIEVNKIIWKKDQFRLETELSFQTIARLFGRPIMIDK